MLYLMRHGQTDWNVEHRLQGHTDVPLNEVGREMAREAREKYKDVHFDICFTSTLSRAKETAEIFLEGRDIPIIEDERLIEVGLGAYEGLIKQNDWKVWQFFKDPEHYVSENGVESMEQILARVTSFLNEKVYPLLEEGKDVLMVAHGGVSKRIRMVVANNSAETLSDQLIMGNCEVVRLL